MNYVRNLCEPSKLVITWQSSQASKRGRLAVAELTKVSDERLDLRYLVDTKDFLTAKEAGFGGLPAFPIKQLHYSDNVLEILRRRLPPKGRDDYVEYLRQFGIPAELYASDFAILGYTEAKLPSDNYNFIHPYDNVRSSCEVVIEVAGFRYNYKGKLTAQEFLNRGIRFAAEPNNKFDSNAVVVRYNDDVLGYVNRIQAPSFRSWIERSYKLKSNVISVAGTKERPILRVLVNVVETGNKT